MHLECCVNLNFHWTFLDGMHIMKYLINVAWRWSFRDKLYVLSKDLTVLNGAGEGYTWNTTAPGTCNSVSVYSLRLWVGVSMQGLPSNARIINYFLFLPFEISTNRVVASAETTFESTSCAPAIRAQTLSSSVVPSRELVLSADC